MSGARVSMVGAVVIESAIAAAVVAGAHGNRGNRATVGIVVDRACGNRIGAAIMNSGDIINIGDMGGAVLDGGALGVVAGRGAAVGGGPR